MTWLTTYLFEELPAVARIEATTREDNRAMRRVLRRCGYVQESRYRRAWPVAGGAALDAVGYAILRSDRVAGRPGPARSSSWPPWSSTAATRQAVAEFSGGCLRRPGHRRDEDSASVEIGGVTVIFPALDDHRPPTWPSPDVPLHAHLDWWVDDLDVAEAG